LIRPIQCYINIGHKVVFLRVGCLAGNRQFGKVTRVRSAREITCKPIPVIIQLFSHRQSEVTYASASMACDWVPCRRLK